MELDTGHVQIGSRGAETGEGLAGVVQVGRRARLETSCRHKRSETKRRTYTINVGPFEFLRISRTWRRVRESQTVPGSVLEGTPSASSVESAHFRV